MCIFILEQLITSRGDRLLTQQQVRYIRDYKGKDHKPYQFQYIEEKVLNYIILKTLKEEYYTAEPNKNAIRCNKLKISADKKKKKVDHFRKRKKL